LRAWSNLYIVQYVDRAGSTLGALTLELTFPQRRRVAGNNDKLGLAGSETLQGRFIS
jgi:hypothetical protein